MSKFREIVHDQLSLSTRSRIAKARVSLRTGTASLRATPDFLIVGAQRCGTSSLYKYLLEHPDISRPVRKEPHYFSSEYSRGEAWYKAHFPIKLTSRRKVFESSTSYLFDPRAPERIQSDLRDVKVIVMLREPAARAYSHYQHSKRLGFESLSFVEALRHEDNRVLPALTQLRSGFDESVDRALWRFSYASRGLYAEQLERWYRCVGADKILILKMEDLFSDTLATYQRVIDFLELSAHTPNTFRNWSYSKKQTRNDRVIPPDAEGFLNEVFHVPNRALKAMTGITWE